MKLSLVHLIKRSASGLLRKRLIRPSRRFKAIKEMDSNVRRLSSLSKLSGTSKVLGSRITLMLKLEKEKKKFYKKQNPELKL